MKLYSAMKILIICIPLRGIGRQVKWIEVWCNEIR